MSFPAPGASAPPRSLAELGSVRERFDSDEHLAAEAGVAPVTYASGKTKAVPDAPGKEPTFVNPFARKLTIPVEDCRRPLSAIADVHLSSRTSHISLKRSFALPRPFSHGRLAAAR
jgi:Transposase IS116/IS110/IS902 family